MTTPPQDRQIPADPVAYLAAFRRQRAIDGLASGAIRPPDDIRWPDVEVDLVGQDGNAYNVLGIVRRALRDADVPTGEVKLFLAEATTGDYDHLLEVVQRWVVVR